jgi:hypothetical protein
MKGIKLAFLTILFLVAIPIKWLCDISVRMLNIAQEKLADFAYYWSVEFDNRKQQEK